MTEDEILDALKSLPPLKFELLLSRLRVDSSIILPSTVEPLRRALSLMQLFKQPRMNLTTLVEEIDRIVHKSYVDTDKQSVAGISLSPGVIAPYPHPYAANSLFCNPLAVSRWTLGIGLDAKYL